MISKAFIADKKAKGTFESVRVADCQGSERIIVHYTVDFARS
jgi:hypothetical protein